ncbi:hypothetical protein BU14_0445s0025 [Porphyra umbilicalis]|uniref:Uncharacterized protein n=1 Tax=Porphyra umbilicalis TaxID=2786 RepID=A0A1X6NVE4_PORUM|nr:hypothetical protein BU14_0445s0025 [Porphyra umbilicalis]|eukprot:OSX72343.1 hypothetical protein BU14_0445s0025 [Porphyra umbilicalis]
MAAGSGDGSPDGDETDASGARKPRGDPEWLDMAKAVGGDGGRKRSFWPFGRKADGGGEEADDARPAPQWKVPDGYGEESIGGGGAPGEASAWQTWSGALDREATAPPPPPRDGKAEVDFWRSSAKEVAPPAEGGDAGAGEARAAAPSAAAADEAPPPPPRRGGVADATPPDDPSALWGMARAVTGEVAELQERLQEEVTGYDLGTNTGAYRDFARGVFEANRGEGGWAAPPSAPDAGGGRGGGGGAPSDGSGAGAAAAAAAAAGAYADVTYTDDDGRVLTAAEVEEAMSSGAIFVDDDGNEVAAEELFGGAPPGGGGGGGGGGDGAFRGGWQPPPPSGGGGPPATPAAFEASGLPPPAPPSLPQRPPSTSTYGGNWDGADQALRELQAEGVPLRDPASETAFWRSAVADIQLPEAVSPPPADAGAGAAVGAAAAAASTPTGVPGWTDFAASFDAGSDPPPAPSSTVEDVRLDDEEFSALLGGLDLDELDGGDGGDGDAAAAAPAAAATDGAAAGAPGVPAAAVDEPPTAPASPLPPAEAVAPPPPTGEDVTSAWSSWSAAASKWEQAVGSAPGRDPKQEVDQWRSAARDLSGGSGGGGATDAGAPAGAASGEDAPWGSSTSFGGGGVASDWGVGLDSEATSERARWGAWGASSPLSDAGTSGLGGTWRRPGEVSGRRPDAAAAGAAPRAADAPSSAATWMDAARDLTRGGEGGAGGGRGRRRRRPVGGGRRGERRRTDGRARRRLCV